MKVLQIIDRLDTGGAERVFIDLTNLLYQSEKIDISILTFNNEGSLYALLNKEIIKIPFTRKNKFNIFEAYKLAKILKGYDIIHVHMCHVYRYVKVVCLLFNVQKRLIFHDHNEKKLKKKSILRLLNSILKPTYYIGVSKELTFWATHKLKVKHVFKLPNIIVLKQTNVERIEKKEGFIIVGNIKPLKNQLFAIRLSAKLDKKLTIVGEVQDQKYYTILVHEISKLGIENKVNFLHNIVNVQELLPKFEMGLMTSISESGPLVLIEFLSKEIPFIAHNTGEVSQILKNELPDFFIDNFKIAKWEKRISEIIDKEYQLGKIFNKYFSQERYINECLSIYQNIINS